MTTTWMIRAGRGGARAEEFLDDGIVAIDFSAAQVGELSEPVTKEQILDRLKQVNPNAKPGRLQVHASQVFRFYSEVRVGDHVVTGDPGQRRFLLGKIVSEARFEGERHVRQVRWTHRASRDALSISSLNTLAPRRLRRTFAGPHRK